MIGRILLIVVVGILIYFGLRQRDKEINRRLYKYLQSTEKEKEVK